MESGEVGCAIMLHSTSPISNLPSPFFSFELVYSKFPACFFRSDQINAFR